MPPATGLESLLPEYRAQYEALLPEIERSVMSDLIRRGLRNSGEATDASARAKAKLLSDLAARSADTRAGQEEAARNRAHQSSEGDAARREARRAQNLGLVGTGLGSLATLGAMKYMGGSGAQNIIVRGDKVYSYDPKAGAREIVLPGGEGAAPAGAEVPWFERGAPAGVPGALEAPSTPPPSMWQKARASGVGGAAAGLAGGLAGNQLAALIGGRSGTAGRVGAGVGGGLGALAAMRYGSGSPWAAGLGALLGSAGGGLLGNLFD